ncbi:MAG TPA: hypothetical protein VF515_14395 [Candidatus Binatia bacterium]
MGVELPNPDTLAVLRALVSLSRLDWLYADQYLHRAGQLLPKVCTRERYLGLRQDQESLPRLTKELRQATERGEWPKVRALAEQAAEARGRLLAGSQILPIADAVYGPRFIHTDVTALALTGVVPQASANLSQARDAVLDQLRTVGQQDKEGSAFYHARVAHFERLQLISGDKPGPVVDSPELRKRILEAVDAGDFARVKQVADSVAAESGGSSARLRVPRPAADRVRDLARAFPEPAVSRACELGLVMETLQPVGGLNAYLGCACADRATFPELPLTEPHPEAESCTCGHPCPPDVRPALRDNLDFLMVHPSITSAGTRYLPWFGPETLLVETFPETDPDARTALLHALGLSRRRGLPRMLVEDALLTHGSDVCVGLGLDPLEYVVTCIPFDVYLRLAPKYGWGQQEFWTHVDGYQVTRDLHLWALVGGNARYGGPDDFSSVQRDYDSERLTARFAVLRRERFLVRETAGA